MVGFIEFNTSSCIDQVSYRYCNLLLSTWLDLLNLIRPVVLIKCLIDIVISCDYMVCIY